jgi:hypothetical protein
MSSLRMVGTLAILSAFILIASCTGFWTSEEGCDTNCNDEYQKCISNPETDRTECLRAQQFCKEGCKQGGIGCAKS